MTTTESTSPQPATPALCRVGLLFGDDCEKDFSLPASVALVAVTEDLVARVNDVLREKNRPLLNAEQTYRLCRADARPLDPHKTLDECGVLDGELLWLLPAESTETYEPVTEMVSTALSRAATELLAKVTPETGRKVVGWLVAATVAWACLILANWWWSSGGTDSHFGWVGAATAWALLAVTVAAARGLSRASADSPATEQRQAAGQALGWTALIPAAAGAAMSLPGAPGLWHVAAAIAAIAVGVIVLAAIWRNHVVATTAILTIAAFAFAAAIVGASAWQVRPERVAVIALIAVIVGVTWAASTATAVSGVPTPLFPSVTNRGTFEHVSGQKPDTVSPVGPTGVVSAEQIRNWVLRGNNTMTGLMVGLAVVTLIAARYAVVPGQPGGWRYTAFATAVCVILVLRSRSFVDRYQSVTLMVAGVGGGAVVIGRYAAAGATDVTVALVCTAGTLGIAVLALLAALVVPYREFSAPIRRFVEIIEYILLLALLPWALWLLDLYPVIRNAVRHGI